MEALFVAIVVTGVLTPVIAKVAGRAGFVDRPGGRKVHTNVTPLGGGIAIFAGFTVAAAGTVGANREVIGIMAGAGLVFATGLADDALGLKAWLKISIQIVASLVLVSSGVVIKVLPSYYANVALTIFGVVGITNAMNFLDNMDGLAAGIAAIICGCFIAVAKRTGQMELAALAMGLGGAAAGFLVFNFLPAKVFMGDAGSTLLGFGCAALAVLGKWSEDLFIASSVPTLILGILIFDTVMITVLRVRNGKVHSVKEWLEYADVDHISHRLARVGLGEAGAVVAIYGLTLFFSVIGVLVQKLSRFEASVLDGLVVVCVVIAIWELDRLAKVQAGTSREAGRSLL